MPVEINEAKYPVVFDRLALRTDSAGAGRFRGGFGTDVIVHMSLDSVARSNMIRSICKPWGIYGGKDAAGNEAYLVTADGEQRMSRRVDYDIPAGQTVRILTGGGGGYGDPLERSVDAVASDIIDGYITPAAAERDYGVVVSADGVVDEEATRNLRSSAKVNA